MIKKKIAFCQELFKNNTLNEICSLLLELGYEGIELAPYCFSQDIRTLSNTETTNIRKTIEDCGIQISAMHWLLVSPSGMSITTLNDEMYNNTKDFFKNLIEFSHNLGNKMLIFGSPKQRMLSNKNSEQEFERAINFFKEMAERCSKYDITIAFEPLGPKMTNFGGTTEEALDIIKKVDHSSFSMMLDTSAIIREGKNPSDLIKSMKNKFIYYHLNDPNELGPGMGTLDFKPIFQAFSEINYSGWVSVEPFSTAVPREIIAKKSMDYLKKININ